MKIESENGRKFLTDSRDFVSFFGIADAYGVDWFRKCNNIDDKSLAQEKCMASMRAQTNRHRHAVYFESVDAPALYVDIIDMLLEKGKHEDALTMIKSCPIRIPFDYKHSWELIPNPELDPHYDEEISIQHAEQELLHN